MSLKVRFEIGFDGSLVLYGFLPEERADGLHLRIQNGRYSIVVYLSDRKRQLGNVGDVPSSPEELKKHTTLMCDELTIEIEDFSPASDLIKALETDQWTEETRRNVLELIKVSYRVHDGIVEYFRNLADQTWLEPISDQPNIQQTVEYVLGKLRAQWLDREEMWRPLTVKQPSTFMTWRGDFGESVDVNEWRQVQSFVEAFINDDRRAPIVDVLLANSLRHLDQENGRLALIEAVIALEALLKETLPKAILNLNSAIEIDEKMLDELIKETGLSLSVKVILRAVSAKLRIDADDIDTVLNAIAVRNNLIHQKQREVSLDRAKQYVRSIRTVVAKLRGEPVRRRTKVVFAINPLSS